MELGGPVQSSGQGYPGHALVTRIDRWRKGVFYGWWMVLVGALLNGISSGFYGTGFTVYFLPLQEAFHLSRAATGTLFGLERMEGGAWGAISGFIIDKWGMRILMVSGVLIAGVGFILLSFTNSFITFLLVFMGVLSLGMNIGFNQGIMAALNNWFNRRRGMAFSLMAVGFSLGGVVITPIVGLVVLRWGWQTAAFASGIAVLALCLPLALFFRNTPEEMGLRPDGDPPADGKAAGKPSRYVPIEGVDYTAKQAFRTWAFWLLAGAIALRIGVRQGIFVHIIPLMVWKGTPEKTAVVMLSIFAFSSAVSRIIAGWVGDRWSRKGTIAVGMVMGASSLVLVMVSGASVWEMAVFLALFGTVDAVASLTWAMIGDYFGRRSFATLRGINTLIVSVVSALMPIGTGFIYDRTGSYMWALVPLSVMYLGVAVLFLVIRPPARKPAQAPLASASVDATGKPRPQG